MGIKSAKDSFSKEDIIDILKQNVTLYKNEPEFVEYIVNLSLYLIDQAYVVGGERSGGLEEILEGFERSRFAGQPGGSKPATPSPLAVPHSAVPPASKTTNVKSAAPKPPVRPAPEASMDSESSEDDSDVEKMPTTSKMRLADFDPVMKSPPPPSEMDDDLEPPTGQNKISGLAPNAPIPGARTDEPTERLPKLPLTGEDEPRTRQLKSVGQFTPTPSGGLTDKERSPRIQVDQSGKARVYKVVRSYSASNGDTNCPICGTDTKGVSRCPSCGHIM